MQEMPHPLVYDGCHRASWATQALRRDSKRQKGAVAVMFAGSLMLIIGFFGLALDLSRVYNRKAEMQGVAATVAVAAAKKLNGTASGISDALAAAHDILGDPYYGPKYDYSGSMVWSDAAIKFSKSANGATGWLSAGEAAATPGELMYVKVDTNALDPAYGRVNMLFMPVVGSSLTIVNVGHTAIAGRSRLGVTPLAICAMATTPAAQRANPSGNVELVEYGFRRGVSYDLMNLNPNGTAPANFLVDPITLPGGSPSANFALATVGPHVCTGTVALPKISGVTVSVQAGFPIDLLFDHLNSRFDLYSGGACDPNAAPPDANVKQYPAASIGWMNPKPSMQTAKTDTTGAIRQTIADLPPPNDQATPAQYGPLWAYARAVPWSSYSGQAEPANGYAAFLATPAVWTSLYSTGPGLSGYPAGATATPYSFGGSFASLPSVAHRPGVKNRRVLNVPLLECPVSGATAKVLSIGKFFMTIQADNAILSAEFAGTATETQLGGPVELYQ